MQQQLVFGEPVGRRTKEKTQKATSQTDAQRLREALAPYLDLKGLQRIVREGGNVREALITPGAESEDVQRLLDAVAAVLAPGDRVQIKKPESVAALLMAEMGHLDQEELRVICLDTKNRVQKIVTVYRGTVDGAMVRTCEVFKEAIRLNSTSIIVCHNHPSGEVTPSPEDVMITRQLVDAGNQLEISVLDHLIVGRGKWISLKERGLGFSK